LTFAFCCLGNAWAQKTDTIVHINGNILTGDLKKMISGVVTWKMDGMGTISVEETKVNTIISKKQFQIKLETGVIFFGSFDESEDHRMVYIVTNNERMLTPIQDIVEIYPIKKSFFMRTSGNFSLGLNYTKGSETTTLAFSGNVDYRNQRTYLNLEWDTNNTFQRDTLNSQKSDILITWQRTLRKAWSTNISIGASQNLELGTQLRTYLNLTGIKDVVYNEWNRLYFGLGANISREIPLDDSDATNDLAGLFIAYWKVYKLWNPKIWVDANVSYIPYLTDSRNRFTFNLNPKVSILSDNFKIGLNFYYTYDSQPVAAGAANDDYGLNLQFTYTYN
jgi:hypothetical protein